MQPAQSFKANECAWHCTRASFQPPLVWEKTRVAAIGCGKEDHWSKEIKRDVMADVTESYKKKYGADPMGYRESM